MEVILAVLGLLLLRILLVIMTGLIETLIQALKKEQKDMGKTYTILPGFYFECNYEAKTGFSYYKIYVIRIKN